MLMGRTSRLAVEVLVELTEQGSQEWMKAPGLDRRIDAEVPFPKQVLNSPDKSWPRRGGIKSLLVANKPA